MRTGPDSYEDTGYRDYVALQMAQARRTPKTAAQVRNRLDSLTLDDAISASAILAEISAGHEEGAERLFAQAGLGDLDVADLEILCRRYEVEYDGGC